MSDELPTTLRGLWRPEAYSHPVQGPRLVTTHISWVLLTGEFAYKIKRPVHFAFIDLRSAKRREFFCREELRLNRRFAPGLYLDVCPISLVDDVARLGGAGAPVEYAVKMRQFPAEQELDHLLEGGVLEERELGAFGREMAAIHARLPVARPEDSWGEPAAIRAAVLKNLDECRDVEFLRDDLEREFDTCLPCMSARRATGRIRECHGDLHAANVVRDQGHLVAFDCMEFEPAFRWIDVAEELAFLGADLEARGYPGHARAFLSGYLRESGDYQACRLLKLYQTHRALVRAKVASLSRQNGRREEYLKYAEWTLLRSQPILILTSGLSGSGKTWLAERLAPLLGAIHIRSDVERKRLAGLDDHARSGSAVGGGMYSKRFTADVYDHLSRSTEDVLAGGFSAIVDATFIQRADRARFGELARKLGVRVYLLQCKASHDVLESRIVDRLRVGSDASEADLEVLKWQEQHFEPLSPDEPLTALVVHTGSVDLEALTRSLTGK